jgi:hypothetical protein
VEQGSVLYCFQAHDYVIRSLQWCDSLLTADRADGMEEPKCNVILTSGNEGKVNIWDVRDVFTPMQLFRARGLVLI